jgi:hypothetical protein
MIHGKAICFVVNLRKDRALAKKHFFIVILYIGHGSETCNYQGDRQAIRSIGLDGITGSA